MSFGERYLTFPDLFPGRPSGDPHGAATVTLDCAGDTYRVVGLSDAQAEALCKRFAGYARAGSADDEAGVEIQVFTASADDFDYQPTPGEAYSFDTDYGSTSLRLAGRNFMARLDRRPGLTVAIWTPHDAEFVTYSDFENIYRVVIAQRLLDTGGSLLHSSGVVIDGAAHIFFGYSGAGKTTVARLGLAQGYLVLSDDIDLLIPARQDRAPPAPPSPANWAAPTYQSSATRSLASTCCNRPTRTPSRHSNPRRRLPRWPPDHPLSIRTRSAPTGSCRT
jgi:hypothetical protein